jgi:hypothetical protein
MVQLSASYPSSSSVKTLVNGLFDYAGLFPPASLPLTEAFSEYLGHRSEPDAWMVGPFVIPVQKLSEVTILLQNEQLASPVLFDVLPRAATSLSLLQESLAEDLAACTRFLETNQGKAEITSFEFRFPDGIFSDTGLGVHAVTAVSDLFEEAGFEQASVFGELVRGASFESEIAPYFLSLSSSQSRLKILGKIRCGGMAQTDFPTTAEIAAYIHFAAQLGYPFKATAGLHHPIRHFNSGQSVWMHGFINVLFAATMARVHSLNPAEIQQILEDEEAQSFIFDRTGIAWRTLKATNTDFIGVRRNLALSIGSCSFNEPRADLFELRLLKTSV